MIISIHITNITLTNSKVHPRRRPQNALEPIHLDKPTYQRCLLNSGRPKSKLHFYKKMKLFSKTTLKWNEKSKIKSHLLLEHQRQPSVTLLPLQQGFPHWTPFPESPAETSLPAPGCHPPLPSPPAEVDVSVSERSTPQLFPRREETPARPGPTRTAAAWRARRWSSVMSSCWREMRANRWLRLGPRRSKGEEGYPERRIHRV